MGRRGCNFLINGIPRVCITQILRSSRISTGIKIDKSAKVKFYIDLIPKQGIWIRLERSITYDIWLCLRKELRILINCFIDTIYEIFQRYTYILMDIKMALYYKTHIKTIKEQ